MVKRKAPGGGGAAAQRGGHGAKRQKSGGAKPMADNLKLYTLQDTTLVLGDGDFTFSKGLVAHRSGGRNLVATSYDSEPKVKAKYSNAADCIQDVRAAGAKVLHGVDATKLHALPQRAASDAHPLPKFFKYIIFNFPHTGQQRVHINRALLLEFFESARLKLVKAGEVHITLKNRPPYSNWNVEEQAKAAGFVPKERRKFNVRHFPGYHHRTTDPQAKKFEAEQCTTYVFVVNRSKYPFDPNAVVQHEDETSSLHGEDQDDEDAQDDGGEEAETAHTAEAESESEGVAVEKQTATTSKKPRKRNKRRAGGGEPAAPSSANDEPVVAATTVAKETPAKTVTMGLWRPLHRRRGSGGL